LRRLLAILLILMTIIVMLPAAALGENELPYGLPKLEITNNTVTYLTWGNPRALENDAANILMQEVYGCKLKGIRTTFQEIPTKAASLQLSGNAPDLIQFREQDTLPYITGGIVDDITPYLDYSDPLYADLKDTVEAYGYKGKYYLFPTEEMYSDAVVYYWTSYFDDLGLETPMELYENGEWTYAALRDMMKELTQDFDRDGIMDIYGLVLHVVNGYLSTGEDFVIWNEETGMFENNLRSPALAEFFNFIHETGSAGENTRRMSLEAQTCFDAKEAVIMMNQRHLVNTYYDQILEGDIGIAPFPRFYEDEEVSSVRGRMNAFYLGKGSANRNGALAYIACCRAIAENEDLAKELAERAGANVREWPEEYEAFFDEIDDPTKFKKFVVRSWDVGTWGDDAWGAYYLYSIIAQFEDPWSTVVEHHYPLLQESIDMANGAYMNQ